MAKHRNTLRKTVFPNGLTLVTERHPEYRSLSVGIWVRAGTRHERRAESGICHFLEHMLFKGTDSRSALDIAQAIDAVGGDFNAFTAREYTCFHVTLLNRDAALGLEILSDAVLNSTFDAEELERERKVILQEIAMIEEAPEELAHDLFFEQVYGRHGLGRPILGSESSIRRLRRADTLRFFKRHYRPDQIVVAVAGDVTHEQVKKMVKPLVKGSWPGRPKRRQSKKELGFEPAPELKRGRWWIKRRTEQVHLVWGVPVPVLSPEDKYAAVVLSAYLGGGMSSALFQEIREKNGLAYTVYAGLTPFKDSGVFSIYAATNQHQVSTCLKLIDEVLAGLKRDLLTDEQLDKVKNHLKGNIFLGDDSAESRMLSIARSVLVEGESASAEEYCDGIFQVTAKDVRKMARKIFKSGRESLLALGPAPSAKLRKIFKS